MYICCMCILNIENKGVFVKMKKKYNKFFEIDPTQKIYCIFLTKREQYADF